MASLDSRRAERRLRDRPRAGQPPGRRFRLRRRNPVACSDEGSPVRDCSPARARWVAGRPTRPAGVPAGAREALDGPCQPAQSILDQPVDAARRVVAVLVALAGTAGRSAARCPGRWSRPRRRGSGRRRPPRRRRSRSIRCWTLERGIRTPWSPVRPRAAQRSKKPSIFSLTPPIAWTSPCWLTEPVTASDCRSGTSAERRQQGVELGRGGAVAVDAAVALLEDQAGGERQRLLGGEAGAEKAGQDQHALRVERARQLDLALDVDHLALAQAHAGGDAAGPAEGEVAELQHRQAVDLADGAAGGVDQHGLAQHRFLDALARPVGAEDAGVDGALDVLGRRHRDGPPRRPSSRPRASGRAPCP